MGGVRHLIGQVLALGVRVDRDGGDVRYTNRTLMEMLEDRYRRRK